MTKSSAIDVRGGLFTLPVLRLLSADLDELRDGLQGKCKEAPAFFANAPVVIELAALADKADQLDFVALKALVRDAGMIPVGVRDALGDLQKSRIADAGLAVMSGGESRSRPKSPEISSRPPARVIHGSVRSGQHVQVDGGDLIVLGTVNQGAEVVADGHIHIYGNLRGRARAGARGDGDACIFALSLEPEVVAIGDEYLVVETPNAALKGRAGRVRLADGCLMLEPL
ncbi:MAG: septum site-determining protein MinC [Gammaproteobacteria bacterium]|nr:septum site-determining protein MinC [Gammaproteobacteria bacterium]MCP5136005.1 septum site-determining protein MinC [Gammaproteobacteria bacterium]